MITYVTSFSPQMYMASGINLVSSFIKMDVDGKLLCTYDDNMEFQHKHERVEFFCLDERDDLKTFLRENDDIIPEALGGSAPPCRCKSERRPKVAIHGRHKPFCTHSGWNFRASQWFRKLVSLKMALDPSEEQCIVWIDSDCQFMRPISEVELLDIFQGFDMFYNYGRHRRNGIQSIETGLMGFKGEGIKAIRNVYNYYVSGKFRQQPRWDDSWAFTKEVETPNRPYTSIDLVPDSCGSINVVEHTSIGKFINHSKGSHHRTGVVAAWQGQ